MGGPCAQLVASYTMPKGRKLLQDMDDEAMAPAPSRRLLQDMDDEAMAPAPMRRRLLNNGATYSAAHKTVLIPKTLYPKP